MSGLQLKKYLIAAAVGGSVLASAIVPANALGTSVAPRALMTVNIDSVKTTPVAHRHHYDRRRHGPRYRHRRHGYHHHYNGYWYRVPFWHFAVPYAGPSRSSRHVQWCDNRYRSYNYRRDAFKGYDGRWHRCNSPYN